MRFIFVRPKTGLKIRDPQTLRHIPEQGKRVVESHYWTRRIQSGDVLLVPSQISDSPDTDSNEAEQ